MVFACIDLKEGRTLERSEVAGEDIYNLTWDIAVEMTRRFCDEAGVPPSRADALIDATQGIDAMRDIAPFIQAATGIARASQAA